ncbi:hypothetical protein GCM10009535_24630 [Streptomyces thermocarboxydovorans]|uniref:ATP-dependent Clp protease proteolytic subunit n=1 Tax=Streptomyces thermocarboxydovorans TaxID=59298 RepID=A0ABN1HG18_9ACTN
MVPPGVRRRSARFTCTDRPAARNSSATGGCRPNPETLCPWRICRGQRNGRWAPSAADSGAGARGTASDLSLQAKEMVRIRSQVEEVLSRHTRHDVETLRADMDRDKVFTAQEAVSYGLADEVLSRRLVMV